SLRNWFCPFPFLSRPRSSRLAPFFHSFRKRSELSPPLRPPAARLLPGIQLRCRPEVSVTFVTFSVPKILRIFAFTRIVFCFPQCAGSARCSSFTISVWPHGYGYCSQRP